LGVAWPSIRDNFGLSQSALGLVLAAGLGGYLVSGLIAGWLTGLLGVGGLLALSSGLVTLALSGYALAPAWGAFFPFGVAMGLGSGAIDAGLNGYAARHFSVRHVNWLHACWGVGASSGPVLMTAAIAHASGYRAGYALLACVLAGMSVAFLLTRRAWNDGTSPLNTSAASAPLECPSMRGALRAGRVWLGMLTFFLYAAVESTTGQWCFTLLREARGLSVERAGAWTAAYWASLTVGRVALGFIVDRVGADALLRLATCGCVIGAACFALGSGALGGVGLLLLGVSLAPIFPTLMSRTPARLGSEVARHAVGFQVAMATLGSTLMPGLVGLIAARVGLDGIAASAVALGLALLVCHEALLRLASGYRALQR
jgi:fucose permease